MQSNDLVTDTCQYATDFAIAAFVQNDLQFGALFKAAFDTQGGDVDHALVEAGRRRLFPWSKLGRVERLWREPPHPEFRERTGWSLLNAFTDVAKRFSMAREMRVIDDLRRLVLECAPNVN